MNAELRGLVDTWHVRGNELAEQYGRLPDGDPAIAILKMTVDTIDRCRSELEAALTRGRSIGRFDPFTREGANIMKTRNQHAEGQGLSCPRCASANLHYTVLDHRR